MKEQQIKAQVEKIVPLTESIMHVILKPERYVDYQAGQYLNILCAEKQFSYSIANAPLGSRRYELYIRHSVENPYDEILFKHIKQEGSVTIQLPFGTCTLDHLNNERPILFVAGGTGFAPVNALVEQLLAYSDPRPLELFWGVRTACDAFLEDKLLYWQAHSAHFKYYSFISETNKNVLISNLLRRHEHDLHQWQIVLSGPFEMVYSLRDRLIKQGIPASQLFSDAFSFEK